MALLFAGASFERSVLGVPSLILSKPALPDPAGVTACADPPRLSTGRALPDANRSLASPLVPRRHHRSTSFDRELPNPVILRPRRSIHLQGEDPFQPLR